MIYQADGVFGRHRSKQRVEGPEKLLPRASQPARRGLHEGGFGGAAYAALVGEGGKAIGVEKPLGGGERLDEKVVEPAPSAGDDELPLSPASQVRPVVGQNK